MKALAGHPHVHLLVPGAAVADTRDTLPVTDRFLPPVKALDRKC